MADEGKGMAANCSSSRKRNAEEADRSGNRKRTNSSILDFVDDDDEAEKKNVSGDDDDKVDVENGSGDVDICDDTEINTGQNGFYNFTRSTTAGAKGTSSNPKDHKPKPQKTFWTVCHGCKMHYEYLRMYLHKNLVCPNCHEPFLAMEIAALFTKVSTKGFKSRKGKNASKAEEEEENESSDDDVEVEEENGSSHNDDEVEEKNSSGDDDDEVEESECSDVDISDETEINIKITPTRKIISLKVKRSDTIGSIKYKIQTMEGIPFEQQELLFKEKVLENINTLVNLHIKNKSTLTLMRKSRGLINISIKTPEGKIVKSFEVKPSDTVGDVKRKIFVAHPVLIFNDNVLEDSCILADLHIIEGSTLTLTGKAVERMKIFVKIFTGKTISLLVDPQSTILDVKWKIKSKEDIPSNEQALIYNKMFLDDSDTLNDLRIKRKSTFTLMRQSTRSMEIFIKTPTEEIFTVQGKPSDTIEKIKAKFRDKVYHPYDDVALIFNEMVLHNDDTLADFHINKGSTLTLIPSSSGSMHIFVNTLNRKTVILNVKPSYTIRDVKSMIRDKEGIDTCKWKLIYNGTQLEDGDTLADNRIPKDSTLEILLQGARF